MQQTIARLRQVSSILNANFLHKEEVIRLLCISVIAGEHMVLIGPPGTAKSAMIRRFSQLIQAHYFEYLLTRFTEPNELFGPVDIRVFREGTYMRRIENMLPTSEIVFLDEVFKSNSAILNSLLTLLNERKFANGSTIVDVPLLSLFGASNEVPNDEALEAIYDRFLLRVYSDNLDSYHFHALIEKGLAYETSKMETRRKEPQYMLNSQAIHELHAQLPRALRFSPEFISRYKALVFQIRNEGITVSDRRVIKLLKLFAASALFDGRQTADESDFFILKHIWNNLDQRDILRDIIDPVLDKYYQAHPNVTRKGGPGASLEDLIQEVRLIEEVLASGEQLSDIQLFSQLKNLNDIKTALGAIGTPAAREIQQRVDRMLNSLFESSKFA
ncbi:MAG: AAA family ATPase [Myxococcota bacterium]